MNQKKEDLEKTTVSHYSQIKEAAIQKTDEDTIQEINEKLIKSKQELEQFTYIASHDLREPIRKIKSFGKLLAQSLNDKLNDDERENFHYMIDGANRMEQMIEALLTYTRISTKGAEYEHLDLNEVVEQLKSAEYAVILEETKGTILVPEPLPAVNGDPAKVRQLMQYLISNALKYHKKDTPPEVIIRANILDNRMVRVEVQDNGIGIESEQCDKVFVMFRRLHSREEYEGVGIGLSVCKKIVERHGGEIGVESTYEQGSSFWFTLPASISVQEQQSEPALFSSMPDNYVN